VRWSRQTGLAHAVSVAGSTSTSVFIEFIGVPGEIRTHDPRIRNPVLYPAELRGPTGSF
jgi:hypothetical protein